ncbi:MAG: zinc-ribbon domain-containing protein [Planctomycetota bacterium]
MILIGTMNLTRTRDRGSFYCPTCGTNQAYRLRASRPFLTLYFIPVIPIGGAEPFVLCDHCRSKWDLTVLQMDRASHETAQQEQFAIEAIRAMVLITLSDQVISEVEIQELQRIAGEFLDRPIDREELGQLCSVANQHQIRAIDYVTTVSTGWNQEQRTTAVQAMFLAATADEAISEKQMNTLKQLPDVLDMTEEEYATAIDVVA